jgi:ABC-2 type transport system permease protein
MMIFIMLSGLFTPVESMPQWAQYLDRINPLFYFVRIMRSIILKGAEFKDLWWEFTTLAGYALTVFSLAIFKYRKTT